MNFIPSASGWPRPQKWKFFRPGMMPNPSPTRLGPIRSCTHEATLRSSRIMYATDPSTTRCTTIAIQTQAGMCVAIQSNMVQFSDGATKRRSDEGEEKLIRLPFVASSLRRFVASYSSQLRELECRLFRVLVGQRGRGEGLGHLLTHGVVVVPARSAEQLVVHVALASGAFRRRHRGREDLDPAGVVLPASVLLRPRGGGEEHIGAVGQGAGPDVLHDAEGALEHGRLLL